VPESAEERALIERAAEALAGLPPNGPGFWASRGEYVRSLYRERIRGLRRLGFIAPPGQRAELDDTRQALTDAHKQLRGIRAAAHSPHEPLGRTAYERYALYVEGRSVSGDPLPSWAEVRRDKPDVANAWVWAALAVVDVVLRGAQNGAHAVADAAEDDLTHVAAREREARAEAEAHPDASRTPQTGQGA
jgi:hypothetical protein